MVGERAEERQARESEVYLIQQAHEPAWQGDIGGRHEEPDSAPALQLKAMGESFTELRHGRVVDCEVRARRAT